MQNPDWVTISLAGNDQYCGQPHYKNKGNHKLPMSNRMPPSNNSNRCSKCGDTAHCNGFICPAKKFTTNLDTLMVNVSKEDSTSNTKLDNPKFIKYT